MSEVTMSGAQLEAIVMMAYDRGWSDLFAEETRQEKDEHYPIGRERARSGEQVLQQLDPNNVLGLPR
jgi:hypothetical protein